MTRTLSAALFGVLLTWTTGAQPPAVQPELPKSQMPDLGRPTKSSDVLPLFDFDKYFAGRWSFEWDVPDSPLGAAGTLTGTTTFTRIDDVFYEATTQATGPAGPITMKDTFAYRKENKTLARHVTDSRGFSFVEIGTVGGDLGGYYTIYFDSSPVRVGGDTIRLRHTMRLLSPVNYKVEMRISVNGGPFTNFGTPWWRKDGATPSPRQPYMPR